MSKKINRLWTNEEAFAAFYEAYPLIFHDDLKMCFVSLMTPGKYSLSSRADWAKSMTSTYMDSDSFAKYLQDFIAPSLETLLTDEAKQEMESFRHKVPSIKARTFELLKSAQSFLVNNPKSSKWLTVIFFAHSRGISTTTSMLFEQTTWSENTLFIMEVEGKFVSADGKALSRLLVRDVKKYSEDFPFYIVRNIPAALATMVGIDETSSFLEGIDYARFH